MPVRSSFPRGLSMILHASMPRCFLRVTAALDYRQSGHTWYWWVDLETGVAVMSWQEHQSSGASQPHKRKNACVDHEPGKAERFEVPYP